MERGRGGGRVVVGESCVWGGGGAEQGEGQRMGWEEDVGNGDGGGGGMGDGGGVRGGEGEGEGREGKGREGRVG